MPKTGQMIYDKTSNQILIYQNEQWVSINPLGVKEPVAFKNIPIIVSTIDQLKVDVVIKSKNPEPAIGQIWEWNDRRFKIINRHLDPKFAGWDVIDLASNNKTWFQDNDFTNLSLHVGPMKHIGEEQNQPKKELPQTNFNRLRFIL